MRQYPVKFLAMSSIVERIVLAKRIAKLTLYRLFTILLSRYVAIVKFSSVPFQTVCRMLYCIVLLWSLNVCRGVNLVFRSCAPNDPAIRFV